MPYSPETRLGWAERMGAAWLDPRGSSWLRATLALYALLALALAAKAWFSPDDHTVYPNFERGTVQWWQEASLYDRFPWIDGYRYSPVFAAACTPLAVLPRGWGGLGWSLFNVGLLLYGLRVAVRDLLPGVWTPRRESAFLLASLALSLRGLWAAQINSLIVALLLLAAAALVRRAWWSAALYLALPTYIQFWPIGIALLAVARWPRTLGRTIWPVAAAVGAAPLLMKRPDYVWWQYRQWFSAVTTSIGDRWPGLRNAWSTWELVQSPVSDWFYIAVQVSVVVGVLLCLAAWNRRGWSTPWLVTLALGLTLSAQLVFGPATERSGYALAAPLMAWGLIVTWRRGPAHYAILAICGVTLLFSFGEVERALLPSLPWIIGVLPLALSAFAGWVVQCGPQLADEALSAAEPPVLVELTFEPALRQAA
jgi:hypothetical protein